MPDPKTYLLRDGHTATLPNHKNDRRDAPVAPVAPWPGAPMGPTGNPMLDGVGPGSYADREDVPELNIDNVPCIVPMRLAEGTYLEARDPDPRGMKVMGADSEPGGVVTEVWVDRAEALIRYLEVEVTTSAGAKRVLLPLPFAKIDGRRGRVWVHAILGSQFADVPATKSPDQVTKFEEDRIVGYYGAGTLYATPARQEPLL
jgi:photosynthetic reaction center H subunit